MDFTNIPLTKPIQPYIECDGYYACCHRCWTEITPKDSVCPKCLQVQDWSWLRDKKEEL